MGLLLRVYRFSAILVWMFLMSLLAAPYYFGRSMDTVRHICFVTLRWGKGLARIFNIKVTMHGQIDTSNGGLLVSNHLSYLDIFIHAALFPMRFAPKAEIKKWPILGHYIQLSHPIWMHRESRQKSTEALRQFKETMDAGIYLIVYPEGTSTDGKSGVRPFKSTPFEAVVSENLPIQPILTLYKDLPNGETACWYGDMTLVPHVWMLTGQNEINVDVYVLPVIYPGENADRKELAKRVHKAIADKYYEVTGIKPENS